MYRIEGQILTKFQAFKYGQNSNFARWNWPICLITFTALYVPNFQLSHRDADEFKIYKVWKSGGRYGLQDFLCFNTQYKGQNNNEEDEEFDLNFCGKYGSHSEKLNSYQDEKQNPPEQLDEVYEKAGGMEEEEKVKEEL